jgi:glucose/arabinose dehydrogenase
MTTYRTKTTLAFAAFGAVTAAACVGREATSATAAAEAPAPKPAAVAPATGRVLTGKDAMGDWTTDAPGVRRRLTVADLPAPFDTPSVDNGPRMVGRPEGAWPKAPAGFKVEQFAADLSNPRVIVTAPNGDLFVAESRANQVRLLRDADGDGKPETKQVFASGLKQPFGIAFYPNGANPKWVYIANTDSVVRFPYKNGDLQTTVAPEVITNDVPGGGQLRGGGHWTRDLVFSPDNKKMFVSVGSLSNVAQKEGDMEREQGRADILQYDLDRDGRRTGGKVFAYGIRNPVGLAIQPRTGTLWTSVNERDGLGDHLPPEYVTSVKEGGFYGWPWYYIGSNQDPRHKGARPDLANKVIVPDVLIQSHSASLDLAFYTGKVFPSEYRDQIFAAEHGSWNRSRRTGYKVIRVPVDAGGRATGEYVDFLTGFVTPDGDVWGRPVGVTTGRDGALYVTDDGGNCIWRVSYDGAKRQAANR